MSTSPKLLAHDLEKGRAFASNSASTTTFALPQRRRKVIILGFLAFAVLFFVYASERNGSALRSSSWKWVKDSMRPASDSEKSTNEGQIDQVAASFATEKASPALDLGVGNEELAPLPLPVGAAGSQQYKPTSALIHLAEELNIAIPTSTVPIPSDQQAPGHADQVLLFLSAMKDKTYKVPELKVQRTKELMPLTAEDFVASLSKVQVDGQEDSKLYITSHDSWLSKHRSQSPLTVFSKSYCPYSKRAKHLLTKMGAHFDVYEIDTREDARSLQDGLFELSGHGTFPTIFVKDDLIGGSDDLARLEDVGVLRGILEGAGVKFD